ncbi:TetR/AcrR family transcriptional regulator [Pseudonocardia spinosispora]|uniref:TetR/AcrR family transcriptional regulator n=1 Tax=Pseudonocardia spinosispora TaxID=103441 RepID=UPI00040C745A|nr:TetR/AcrR family transcriptional regulator [Pseudonocardia spinosispora]
MNAGRTARERARAELTREITDAARRQLASVGAEALSLRAVARELDMASSALYRYFPSKDDLLTALIIEAYDSVGEAAERAATSGDPTRHWDEVCAAVRDWARSHVHEYALIYGSPVSGYRAPRSTVAPAARVPLVLIGILRAAWSDGRLTTPQTTQPTPGLDTQIRDLAAQVAPELPGPVLTRVIVAWTQLFGMISFELFGQLVGSVDPSDEFFAHTTTEMAAFVGLPR